MAVLKAEDAAFHRAKLATGTRVIVSRFLLNEDRNHELACVCFNPSTGSTKQSAVSIVRVVANFAGSAVVGALIQINHDCLTA